jgi:hypothetical protein
MEYPIAEDGRNAYAPQQMQALGFSYRSVGCGYSDVIL